MPQDQDVHLPVQDRHGRLPYAIDAVFGTIMTNYHGNLTGPVRL
jgi:hypothetical protein